MARAEVPWLSRVSLPWGLELSPLNISRSGILFETSTKLLPGDVVQFQICGHDTTLSVRGRFVRSEVAAIDGCGVKYHVAAVFERELDLDPSYPNGAEISSTSKNLADWFLQMAAALDRCADPVVLRERIAQGLRNLVPARDIQIRDAPLTPQDGCESIYFKVAVGNGSQLVLQVTFERGTVPSALEFRLLQAGSALAGVVLECGCSITERPQSGVR